MLKRIKDDLAVEVRVITVERLIRWIEFIKRVHIALSGCLRSLQTNLPLQRSLTQSQFQSRSRQALLQAGRRCFACPRCTSQRSTWCDQLQTTSESRQVGIMGAHPGCTCTWTPNTGCLSWFFQSTHLLSQACNRHLQQTANINTHTNEVWTHRRCECRRRRCWSPPALVWS